MMSENTRFWRTREEFEGDQRFLELLHNEFPSQVEAISDPVAPCHSSPSSVKSCALQGSKATRS